MLRNRSRGVNGKQALMADHTSQSSSLQTKSVQNSIFNSSRLFKAFSTPIPKSIDYSLINPTTILDSKSFFSHQIPKTRPNFTKQKTSGPIQPIGLALIDSKPSKSVFFSSNLRVQVPPAPPDSGGGDGGGDGGKGGSFYPCRIGDGLMTVKEMEVCEEYTCVRTHGPNAKVTHIFYNFVVESFVDCDSKKTSMTDEKKGDDNDNDDHDNDNDDVELLSFCYTFKNNLELMDNIFI